MATSQSGFYKVLESNDGTILCLTNACGWLRLIIVSDHGRPVSFVLGSMRVMELRDLLDAWLQLGVDDQNTETPPF